MRAAVILLFALFASIAYAQSIVTLNNGQFRTYGLGGNLLTGPVTPAPIDNPLITFAWRPFDGQFYALSAGSNLYTVNPVSGATTLIGIISCTLNTSVTYYSSWNPVGNALRVIGSDASNRRIFGSTYNCSFDTPLSYGTNASSVPTPVGLAYTQQTRAAFGTGSTAEYITDNVLNRFSRVTVPNAGTTVVVGTPATPTFTAPTLLSVFTNTTSGQDLFYGLDSNGLLYAVNSNDGTFTATTVTITPVPVAFASVPEIAVTATTPTSLAATATVPATATASNPAGAATATASVPSGAGVATATNPAGVATATPSGATAGPTIARATATASTPTRTTTNSAVATTVSIAAVAAAVVCMM